VAASTQLHLTVHINALLPAGLASAVISSSATTYIAREAGCAACRKACRDDLYCNCTQFYVVDCLSKVAARFGNQDCGRTRTRVARQPDNYTGNMCDKQHRHPCGSGLRSPLYTSQRIQNGRGHMCPWPPPGCKSFRPRN
jgi:hypothetical protein